MLAGNGEHVDPMIAVEQRYFVGHKCWLTVKSTLFASLLRRRLRDVTSLFVRSAHLSES